MAQLGSHQFLDDFALAYHRVVADRLRQAPVPILQRALANLAQWTTRGELSAGALLSLAEWQHILEDYSVEKIILLITANSDEGQRLRQSTPFAGILTPAERKDLLAHCEERANA